jgi:methylenetetrahydrofolate dehydrogenase (NADP+)/methenyltetrahydrofolate cyclohydrolase
MKTKILYAAPVVEKIQQNLLKRCKNLNSRGIEPSMCVVLVGNNPASMTYVRNKKLMCEKIGAKFRLEHMSEDISPENFLNQIKVLNEDDSIHGIIIQLPVSRQLKSLSIAQLVTPKKDIDGFHGINTQKIYQGSTDLDQLLPCTPKGIIKLLNHYGISLESKTITVIGRSLIVGKPLAMLLSNFNATVIQAHSKTQNLRELTALSDIVISAVGKPNFLDHTFFNPNKNTILVDVGMNSFEGKLVGDANIEDSKDHLNQYTPVPGGVGPMTVICLLENLIFATEQIFKGKI